MAGGGVWTSPPAEHRGGHLSDQRNTYNSAVGRLDDGLVAMIARTPEKSSLEEAELRRIELGG